MREILFRGKRLDNGEWVYGDLVWLMDGNKKSLYIYGKAEVNPATIGQYTGLTDKNGKRIFEGDVVAQSWYDHDEPIDDVFGEVVYCTNDCSFSVLNMEKGTMDQLGHCKAFAWEIEVCGNIHDNPELLKGEGNESI